MPLRFPGQWQDTESGTAYNVSRDYDPSLGRYLQSDAAGLDGGWNTYAYAGGNPVNAIDPDGRNPLLLGMLAFLAYELTAQPANAPGPGEALLTPSPWAPATNALAVAGIGGAGGLGNCVAARKVGRYLFNAAVKNTDGSLPANPSDLLNRGYRETSHPNAAAAGYRTFENSSTGDKVRFDAGRPGSSGFEGGDHYHRYNPSSTGKADMYLDKNGAPCARGCNASHLFPNQ